MELFSDYSIDELESIYNSFIEEKFTTNNIVYK